MTVEDAESADHDEADVALAARGSPGYVLAVVLCVVFGLAAIVLAVVAAGAGDDGESGDRQAVRRVAGQFGEALLTYDHRDLAGHRERVLVTATTSFADEYEEAFSESLSALIEETKASSTATVKDIFLSELDEGTAEAILVADLRLTGAGGPRTVSDVYFKLELVRIDGEWKVDDVVSPNFSNFDVTGDGSTTRSTTSTTAG